MAGAFGFQSSFQPIQIPGLEPSGQPVGTFGGSGQLPGAPNLPSLTGPTGPGTPPAPVPASPRGPLQSPLPGLGGLDFSQLQPSASSFGFEDPAALDPLADIFKALGLDSPTTTTGGVGSLQGILSAGQTPQQLSQIASLFGNLSDLRNPFESAASNLLSRPAEGGPASPGPLAPSPGTPIDRGNLSGSGQVEVLQKAFEDLIKRLNTGIA